MKFNSQTSFINDRRGEIGTIAVLIGMVVVGLGILVGSQVRNQNINLQPRAAIENFPTEAWWTDDGDSNPTGDRIDFIIKNGYPCNDGTRAAVHVYDSRNNNKDLGLMTQFAGSIPSGYNGFWEGRWPDQNAELKCYIRFYGSKDSIRLSGLPQYIRLAIPSQTALSNEVNLGNPPQIPNCTNLKGPTSLVVGQAGTFTATVTSQQGELRGEIFEGNYSVIKNQFFGGSATSGNLSGTWTPTRAGTYTIYCRAWNDGIAECRPPNLVDRAPRYACAGPGYQMTVNVVNPTNTPVPQSTCVPQITAPGNNSNISTVPATMSWKSCGSGYTYQLNFTQGFAWTSFGLSGTSHKMDGFTFNRGTTYKWRIRSCLGSSCSAWSSTYTFTYPALPTNTPIPTSTPTPAATCIPQGTGPANNSNITTIPATMTWKSCGSGYYYQLNFTQGFAWTSFGLSGTSHKMDGFTFNRGTTYKWRIRSCRDSGCKNVSSWSPTYTFTYPALPTNTPIPTSTPTPAATCVPQGTGPANNSNITTIPATMTWKSCGTGYGYQLNFTQGFAWTSNYLTGTSHKMDGFTFNRGTTYKWRIRSCRDSGCKNVSSWSPTYTFTYPNLPTNPPIATNTPKATNTPVPTTDTCPKRSQGDANCDGVIDYIDFICWRGELIGQKPTNCVSADFDGQGGSKPNSADYTIWWKSFNLGNN